MLIEEEKSKKKNEEVCFNCGSKLNYSDYLYRRIPSISGYQCSKCGFFEFINQK